MKILFQTDNPKDGLVNLFGHVRIRVLLSDRLYIDVGRFSLGVIPRIRLYTNVNFDGLAARVGDYCEFSDCRLLLGGEHKNGQLINLNFSASPVFQKLLLANGVDVRHARKGPIVIGDGVVVGHGATILSGVTIGDGTVIGASSLVASNCDQFSVYAGNPAKKINDRHIDHQAFRKFISGSVASAFSSLTNKVLEGAADDGNSEDRLHIRVQFVDPINGGPYAFQFLGAAIDGKYYPLTEGSEFYQYCMQAKLPAGSEMEWLSNPLALNMEV